MGVQKDKDVMNCTQTAFIGHEKGKDVLIPKDKSSKFYPNECSGLPDIYSKKMGLGGGQNKNWTQLMQQDSIFVLVIMRSAV